LESNPTFTTKYRVEYEIIVSIGVQIAIEIANNLGAKTVISPVKVIAGQMNFGGTEKLWNSILFCTCR
jgi:hypothetical protein